MALEKDTRLQITYEGNFMQGLKHGSLKITKNKLLIFEGEY
jgi:hypothetical protein